MELFRLRCQSQPWGLAVNICSPLAVKWTLHGTSPMCKPIRGAVPLAATLWFLHKLLDNQRGSVMAWDEICILKHERTISESRVPADSVITGVGRGEGGVWGVMSWIMGTRGWPLVQTGDTDRLRSFDRVWGSFLRSTLLQLAFPGLALSLLSPHTWLACLLIGSVSPSHSSTEPHEWN